MNQKIQTWLLAARPKTLIASISPVCIGTSFAVKIGQFHWLIFIQTLLFALLIQIGTNLANDYYDHKKGADTKNRKGPVRVCSAKLIDPGWVKLSFLLIFSLAFFVSFSLVLQSGVFIGIIMTLSILCGILYTAGPFPISYLGLGEFFVLVFFGPIACFGSYYLQTNSFELLPISAGFGPGLISCAVLTANNLRDHIEDARAGKKTLVVRFGQTFGKCEYIFCLFFASILLLTIFPFVLTLLFLGVLAIIIIPLFKKVVQDPEHFTLLPKTVLFLFIYTFLFIIGVFAWS